MEHTKNGLFRPSAAAGCVPPAYLLRLVLRAVGCWLSAVVWLLLAGVLLWCFGAAGWPFVWPAGVLSALQVWRCWLSRGVGGLGLLSVSVWPLFGRWVLAVGCGGAPLWWWGCGCCSCCGAVGLWCWLCCCCCPSCGRWCSFVIAGGCRAGVFPLKSVRVAGCSGVVLLLASCVAVVGLCGCGCCAGAVALSVLSVGALFGLLAGLAVGVPLWIAGGCPAGWPAVLHAAAAGWVLLWCSLLAGCWRVLSFPFRFSVREKRSNKKTKLQNNS